MFWTFLATALLAVIAMLWRLKPTIEHSLKAVTLRGMDAAMVVLLAISLDMLMQAAGIEKSYVIQAVIYLMGAASVLAFAWFLVSAKDALVHWYKERNEGGEHFDFG